MYTSDLAATIAVIGLIGAAVLLGIVNRHWIIEVFSLVPAIAGIVGYVLMRGAMLDMR